MATLIGRTGTHRTERKNENVISYRERMKNDGREKQNWQTIKLKYRKKRNYFIYVFKEVQRAYFTEMEALVRV